MSYGQKYKIEFQDPDKNRYQLIISQSGYSGGLTILAGGDATVQIKYTNNDDTKYPKILGSSVTVNFISQNNFNLQEIITQDDLEYRVELYFVKNVGGTDLTRLLHRGYLVTDNCTQLAQDDPKPIQLVSSDSLGQLKNTVIYDLDTYEKKPILEYLFKIFTETGLELPLLVECGVFETHMDGIDVHPYSEPFHQAYIHSRTFMKDVDSYDDCFTVLEKICNSWGLTAFQQNGQFVIQRRHSRWNAPLNDDGALFPFPYITPSDITPHPTATNYSHRVDALIPINASHIIGFTGGNKSTKETFKYILPEQLPRNVNFQQGDFLSPVSGPTNTAFTINYWDAVQNPGDIAASATCFRNEVFDPVLRTKESYVVVTREDPSVDNGTNLRSQLVEVQAGDRVHISFNTRAKDNFTVSTTANIRTLRVYLTDGVTTYHLRNDKNWYSGTPQAVQFGALGPDADVWFPCDIESADFPIDGDLRIYLCGWDSGAFANETWFRDFQVEFLIFRNQSTLLSGEFDSETQVGTFRNAGNNTLEISDSPKKIINGTMTLISDNSLTYTWYRPGVVEAIRFIHIQDLAAYQSSYRLYMKLEGDFKGNVYEDPDDSDLKILIGPQNTFSFPSIPNKVWIPTNMDLNISAGTCTMSLQEFFDSTLDGGDPMGTNVFQYIYE